MHKSEERTNHLWYRKPASEWEEALPVGNGRLGAMMFGAVKEERIDLNEESLWYGTPRDYHNPDTLKNLDEIKQLLFKGEVEKAEWLTRMAMSSCPKYINPYQPLGTLNLFFQNHTSQPSTYMRGLDLHQAIAYLQYEMDGVTYRREIFSSFPDDVIVMKISCSRAKGLSFCATITRRPFDCESSALDNSTIVSNGACGDGGIKFQSMLKAFSPDGTIQTIGDYIEAKECTEVLLIFSAVTSFQHAHFLQQATEINQSKIAVTAAKQYDEIRKIHIADYQNIANRSALFLGHDNEDDATDVLISRCKQGENANALTTLFWNYGKYLLISSSREGGLPANLQGIWNNSFTPAWECSYTININLQMNYWHAQTCNLLECTVPLFDFVDRLVEKGKVTAQKLYGCHGFVAHHVSNIWADSVPFGMFISSPYWAMGGNWLSLHLWEYYLHTQDVDFLCHRVYPVLKEAVLFCLDYLTEREDGTLVPGPSASPENTYYTKSGYEGALCMGSAMDRELIVNVFEAFLEAHEILSKDAPLAKQVASAKEQIPPIQIGKHGQIVEWDQDYDEVDPGHRHISQLFALHPGNGITKTKTPALFEAARTTLERRLSHGGGHTGWSKAWIINFWARLMEGEKAHENLMQLFSNNMRINLFDTHPPFQIDGNFGATAAINEMIVQSHDGFIHLLPALPKDWASGEIKGFCCRGGFVLDMIWENQKVIWIKIHSTAGNGCKMTKTDLSVPDNTEVTQIKENILMFATEKGRDYIFKTPAI